MAWPRGLGAHPLRLRRSPGIGFPEVKAAIIEFRDNDQTIWFTGHSLGGALARLAAARLYFEESNLLADGVYSFGQPRTCDWILARAYDKAFTDRTYRFINNNDIVTQLPPEPAFHHVKNIRPTAAGQPGGPCS